MTGKTEFVNQQRIHDSSNKTGLILSTERCPDMVPIYRKLLTFYAKKKDECPSLFVVEDLPDGLSYIKCSDILIVKCGIPLDHSMTRDNYRYRGSIPLYSFKDTSYDIYALTLLACDRMNIRSPQIILSNELKDMRGIARQDNNDLTKLIELRVGMDLSETAEVLFHELRHAWQHEKHPNKYFSNYKYLDTGIEMEEYMKQPAEIDAEAFSVRMMVEMGMEKYPVRRKSFDDLNKIIEAKAKRMCFPNPQ